jgi:hypothetical protein
VNTAGLLLIMGGALLIWAGLTDNSIISLVGGIFGKSSGSSNSGATASNPSSGKPSYLDRHK